jgi:uncharacterized OB-fold protein
LSHHRQLPLIDAETGWYWTGGADGRLRIARCGGCGHYQHPPLPRCPVCGSDAIAPAPVSGRGRIAAFTVNHEAWKPGLPVPFIFAAVELAEQPELYVFTNILGPVEAVRSGLPVTVAFERHEDVFLPMFRIDDDV